MDLSTCEMDSPLGRLLLTAGCRGLCRLQIGPDSSCTGPESTDTGPILRAAAIQLQAYFAGERTCFDLPLDLSGLTPFTQQVLTSLQTIPMATTISYGELAAFVGKPRAARAVGRVMAINPLPLIIPCHRVVGGDGAMVGYSGGGGVATKMWLLAFEKQVVGRIQPD
jgi:methylated-DNA-[protein]-cysteine S-methyltransferase